MKRFFDIFFSTILIIFLFPILLIICILILIIDKHNPIYFSKRIGLKSKMFLMPKFRTMKKNTPQVATNDLKNPKKYLSICGNYLRKSSIDELPQIFLVFTGKMSFVGPRPALFNQKFLIKKRKLLKIDLIKPGITGYAQINGRDEIPISKKISLDKYYLENGNFLFDLKIIFQTIKNSLASKQILH